MARKVRRSGTGTPYYGPNYNPRADARAPDRTQYDGDPRPKPQVGVYKGGKTKTVLRDPAAYDRRNKRPRRD